MLMTPTKKAHTSQFRQHIQVEHNAVTIIGLVITQIIYLKLQQSTDRPTASHVMDSTNIYYSYYVKIMSEQ